MFIVLVSPRAHSPALLTGKFIVVPHLSYCACHVAGERSLAGEWIMY